MIRKVTGYPTAYVWKDILGSVRKKQNKNTLKNEPATLQRYPSVTIEVSKTPRMYMVTIFVSVKFSF